jgi:hypothetical protein
MLPKETQEFASWLLDFMQSYIQDGERSSMSEFDDEYGERFIFFSEETRDLKTVLTKFLSSYLDDAEVTSSATLRIIKATSSLISREKRSNLSDTTEDDAIDSDGSEASCNNPKRLKTSFIADQNAPIIHVPTSSSSTGETTPDSLDPTTAITPPLSLKWSPLADTKVQNTSLPLPFRITTYAQLTTESTKSEKISSGIAPRGVKRKVVFKDFTNGLPAECYDQGADYEKRTQSPQCTPRIKGLFIMEKSWEWIATKCAISEFVNKAQEIRLTAEALKAVECSTRKVELLFKEIMAMPRRVHRRDILGNMVRAMQYVIFSKLVRSR